MTPIEGSTSFQATSLGYRPLEWNLGWEIAGRVKQMARESRQEVVVVGGLAVMAHLRRRGMEGWQHRSSLDVDVLASGLPLHHHQHLPLLAGGIRLHIEGVAVDWLVKTERYRQMIQAALMEADRKTYGAPLASAAMVAALKMAVPRPAFRPKDRTDLRLLFTCGVTTGDQAMAYISRYLPHAVSEAKRNLAVTMDGVTPPVAA